jgi:hypothetical protein
VGTAVGASVAGFVGNAVGTGVGDKVSHLVTVNRDPAAIEPVGPQYSSCPLSKPIHHGASFLPPGFLQ